MNTLDKIIAIVNECTENRLQVDANTNMIEDGLINSFDRLMIVNAIEDEYKMEFDEADFKNMKVIKDFVEILEAKYLKNTIK